MTTLVNAATKEIVATKPKSKDEKTWLFNTLLGINSITASTPKEEISYTSFFSTFKSAVTYVSAKILDASPDSKKVLNLCNLLKDIAFVTKNLEQEEKMMEIKANPIYILHMKDNAEYGSKDLSFEIFNCNYNRYIDVDGIAYIIERNENLEV
jgi:hypothetical protein